MLLDNVEASQAQEDVKGQSDQTETQSDVQDNALSSEKAYAKKMRHRAQVAEQQLADLQKVAKEKEEQSLADQGKYKEMYESLKKDAKTWKKSSDEYIEFKDAEKSVLLEGLPEEDKELFKDLNLKQLKAVVNKVKVKPDAPKVVHGGVPLKDVKSSFKKMSSDERKENWDAILNSYSSAKK